MRISHRLHDVWLGTGLRWSPDGRWVAYRDANAHEIWAARSDGRGERLIVRDRATAIARFGIVGWTPRGSLVIGTDAGRFAARPEAGRPEPYGGRFPAATLAPDGTTRAAVERDEQGNDQIVVGSPRGRLGRLTNDRALPADFTFEAAAPAGHRTAAGSRLFAVAQS